MIPEGAHPRVTRPWFWTGVVYGVFVLPFFGAVIPGIIGIIVLVEGDIGPALGFLALQAAICLGYLGWLAWYVGALQRSFRFELGEDTLTIQRGVWWRKTSRIPLRRVQDVVARDGPFLRMASLGTVHVQTAGLSTPNGFAGAAEGVMPGLRDPQAVAEEILEKVKRLRGDV